MSPYTALCQLLMFKRGIWRLTVAEFDAAFDRILEVLEEVNNERFRCTDEDSQTDAQAVSLEADFAPVPLGNGNPTGRLVGVERNSPSHRSSR